MPPEEHKQVIEKIAQGDIPISQIKVFVWVVLSMAMGLLARTLIDPTPIDWRRFAGELILAVLAGVTLFAFGVIQEMESWQIVVMGGLAGLGGVRLVEWIIKIARNGLPGGGLGK